MIIYAGNTLKYYSYKEKKINSMHIHHKHIAKDVEHYISLNTFQEYKNTCDL